MDVRALRWPRPPLSRACRGRPLPRRRLRGASDCSDVHRAARAPRARAERERAPAGQRPSGGGGARASRAKRDARDRVERVGGALDDRQRDQQRPGEQPQRSVTPRRSIRISSSSSAAAPALTPTSLLTAPEMNPYIGSIGDEQRGEHRQPGTPRRELAREQEREQHGQRADQRRGQAHQGQLGERRSSTRAGRRARAPRSRSGRGSPPSRCRPRWRRSGCSAGDLRAVAACWRAVHGGARVADLVVGEEAHVFQRERLGARPARQRRAGVARRRFAAFDERLRVGEVVDLVGRLEGRRDQRPAGEVERGDRRTARPPAAAGRSPTGRRRERQAAHGRERERGQRRRAGSAHTATARRSPGRNSEARRRISPARAR